MILSADFISSLKKFLRFPLLELYLHSYVQRMTRSLVNKQTNSPNQNQLSPSFQGRMYPEMDKSRLLLSYAHSVNNRQNCCSFNLFISLLKVTLISIAVQHLQRPLNCHLYSTLLGTSLPPPLPTPTGSQKGCSVKHNTKTPLQQNSHWTKIMVIKN